jgi:hypothetical protein
VRTLYKVCPSLLNVCNLYLFSTSLNLIFYTLIPLSMHFRTSLPSFQDQIYPTTLSPSLHFKQNSIFIPYNLTSNHCNIIIQNKQSTTRGTNRNREKRRITPCKFNRILRPSRISSHNGRCELTHAIETHIQLTSRRIRFPISVSPE